MSSEELWFREKGCGVKKEFLVCRPGLYEFFPRDAGTSKYSQMVQLPMASQSFQRLNQRKSVGVDEAVDNHVDGAIPNLDSSFLPLLTDNSASDQEGFASIQDQLGSFGQTNGDFTGQITNNTPLSDFPGCDYFPSQNSGNQHCHDWIPSQGWQQQQQQPLGSASQGVSHSGFGPVPNITYSDYSTAPATRVQNPRPSSITTSFFEHYNPAMADEPSLPSPRSEHGASPRPIQVRAESMTPTMGMHQDNSSADEEMIKEMGSRKHVEVPRNEDNKIICLVPGCETRTFDRKCEWTKHMDKHERPYRCPEPGCEKLRGFTYSGGLLRHQREVHKKHGGPKELLMCPVPYCKRNTGTGFTRKENRDEHIRRVHRQLPGTHVESEQQSPLELLVAATNNNDAPPTDPALPPYQPFEAPAPPSQSPPVKARKRKTDTSVREAAIEIEHAETARAAQIAELRNELEKLRRDNEEKDLRISRLEETVQIMTLNQATVQRQGDADVRM